MLTINGTNITLTRGNTAELLILPTNEDGTPYILEENDKVLFTVKNGIGKEMLQKEISSTAQDAETGEITVVLSPEDTIRMNPQAYTYDVLLVTASGDAYTFIPQSAFEITLAVGSKTDLGGDGT